MTSSSIQKQPYCFRPTYFYLHFAGLRCIEESIVTASFIPLLLTVPPCENRLSLEPFCWMGPSRTFYLAPLRIFGLADSRAAIPSFVDGILRHTRELVDMAAEDKKAKRILNSCC